NNVSVAIVGVLPQEFTGIERAVGSAPDISFPLALDPQLVNAPPSRPGVPVQPRLSQPTYWWLRIIGRLKPGVRAQQVEGNFEGMFRQSARWFRLVPRSLNFQWFSSPCAPSAPRLEPIALLCCALGSSHPLPHRRTHPVYP